jgi:hypothetical protein
MTFKASMVGPWGIDAPIVFNHLEYELGFATNFTTTGKFVVPKNGSGRYFFEIKAFSSDYGSLLLVLNKISRFDVNPLSNAKIRRLSFKGYVVLSAGDEVYIANFFGASPINWLELTIQSTF